MERINSLDVVRGVALLGLLPMNILSFALPVSSYFNPVSFQGDWWFTYFSHTITHVLFDQKMMGVFSFLFGCSIVLISNAAKEKGRSPSLRHYLRNFLLLLFGFAHTVYLWDGDILFLYALLAFFLYPFSYVPWRILLLLAVLSWSGVIFLTGLQHEYLLSMDESVLASLPIWQPDDTELQQQVNYALQPYSEQVSARFEGRTPWHDAQSDALLDGYFVHGFLRALSMMFAGMALMKAGFWQRKESASSFTVAAIAISGGWLLALAGVAYQMLNDWSVISGMGMGSLFNQVATPVVVGGYVLWLKSCCELRGGRAFSWLSNVGRMAFSNYIMQSVIMSFLFYGYGYGLFASLNRLELWLIVVLVCMLQIVYSNIWMSYFRYGPLEWIWRKLSFA